MFLTFIDLKINDLKWQSLLVEFVDLYEQKYLFTSILKSDWKMIFTV